MVDVCCFQQVRFGGLGSRILLMEENYGCLKWRLIGDVEVIVKSC